MASQRMLIIKRDDSDFELTFKDIDSNPIDLTDGTVFFTVKRNKKDTDENAIIKKHITTFEDPTLGICTLSLSSSDTDILPGDYWFDVQLKDKLGRISSTYAGRMLVKQDITIRTDIDTELS
jgi:hypothetical protein